MKDLNKFNIVHKPIISEKSMSAAEAASIYTFEVAPEAKKADIKGAVEELFNVKVAAVRIINVKGKPRRLRMQKGHTRNWKKALVQLSSGRIDLI